MFMFDADMFFCVLKLILYYLLFTRPAAIHIARVELGTQ